MEYCSPSPAFLFTKTWYNIVAVKTSEIADHLYIANALDNLVLPDEHKSLLKVLCDSRKVDTLHRSMGPLDQDRLKTKEGSHVVLLYGNPGVGKAFTVGVCAKYHDTQRLFLHSDRMRCKLQQVPLNHTYRWGLGLEIKSRSRRRNSTKILQASIGVGRDPSLR